MNALGITLPGVFMELMGILVGSLIIFMGEYLGDAIDEY